MTENKHTYDAVVVGSGFAGATAANILASNGYKVLVVERRHHIGGQMYEYRAKNGMLIHKYGPHIFHTNDEMVYEYLKQFMRLDTSFVHKVTAYINGQYVDLPFNANTAHILNDVLRLEYNKLRNSQTLRPEVKYSELCNDAPILSRYIYDTFLKNYSQKQWGHFFPTKLDAKVLDRVPIRLNSDNRYFTDKYQGLPEFGYTDCIMKMLDHDNINVMTNCDFNSIARVTETDKTLYVLDSKFDGPIFYSGTSECIMQLIDVEMRHLPYRSLTFDFIHSSNKLPSAVVNYPNNYDRTRTTDFSHFNFDVKSTDTVLCNEISIDGNGKNDFYYPIPSDETIRQYQQNVVYIKSYPAFKNIFFIGRAGLYRYMNMDMTVHTTMSIVNEFLLNNRKD